MTRVQEVIHPSSAIEVSLEWENLVSKWEKSEIGIEQPLAEFQRRFKIYCDLILN